MCNTSLKKLITIDDTNGERNDLAMQFRIIVICAILLITSCNNRLSKSIDSTELSNHLVELKSLSKIEKIEVSDYAVRNDTLWGASGDKFLYYPLGIYQSIYELAAAYSFMNKKQLSVDKTILNQLYFKQNSIVTVLDTDNSGKIEIVYAKISDSDIVLSNGIKVGLDKSEFTRYLPLPLQKSEWDKIRIVLLESELLGIWNYYFFNNNKLDSILFISDYEFDLTGIEYVQVSPFPSVSDKR